MSKNIMKEVAKLLGVELNEKFNVKGIYFNCNPCQFKSYGLVDHNDYLADNILRHLLTGACTIEKPILDKKEKEYLSSVIAPKQIYKNVKYIVKTSDGEDFFILIKVNEEYVCFPFFTNKNMYKGMEVDREYTLEELGLIDNECKMGAEGSE